MAMHGARHNVGDSIENHRFCLRTSWHARGEGMEKQKEGKTEQRERVTAPLGSCLGGHCTATGQDGLKQNWKIAFWTFWTCLEIVDRFESLTQYSNAFGDIEIMN